MEYYLDEYYTLYYRINHHFLWTLFPRDEIERMMFDEREMSLNRVSFTMGIEAKKPGADLMEITNRQYFMTADVMNWYNGWDITNYTYCFYQRLIGNM